MAGYRFESTGHGPGHAAPDFQEQLYDALRATPWWLASATGHVVALLLLSVLLGGGGGPPPEAPRIMGEIVERVPEPEPDIQPDIEPTKPITEPEDSPITELPELKSDDSVETDAELESTVEGPPDPRFTVEGAFEGPGSNSIIGAGAGAGGGLTGRAARRRNLRLIGIDGTESATDAGLEWLRRHQSVSGAWDGDGFEAQCKDGKCGGAGGPLYDPGLTGLALLAFLGTGETHKSGKYQATVRSGLKWLKTIQDAEGCYGPRTSSHFTYNHAIASMAVVEAYGLTQSPLFKASAQRGLDFIKDCRNPYLAWRYGVRPQDNDTSVTGWMVMALKAGVMSGLDVDPEGFEGARNWIDKATEPEYGRTGYTARGNGPSRAQEQMDRFPADKSESLTAVGVLTRIYCGAKEGDEMVAKGADLCMKSLPTWDEAAGTCDFYYWYYGTLAMWQVGGPRWKRWEAAMKPSLVEHQRLAAGECRHGSWDPVDPWGPDGGRVYSTAINTLSLEVYYRIQKMSFTK
jgi:hypothetical protein